MKKHLIKALAGSVPALVFLSLGSGEAFAMKCVKPSGTGGCTATIQAAVAAAVPGELIRIFPGLYPENVTVGTAGLQLVGQGTWPGAVVITPPGGTIVSLSAPNVTLKNLTIQDGGDCLVVTGAGAKVIDTNVTRCSATGISAVAGNLLIQGSSVRETTGGGIVATGDGVTVAASSVHNVGGTCIEVNGNAARITGNQIFGCGLDGALITGSAAAVSGNSLRGAGRKLIKVTGPGARIASNQLEGAASNLMRVFSDSPVITGNTAKDANSGIDVFCASCLGGQIADNVVSDVYDCPGFSISGETPGLIVQRNSSTRNSQSGFELGGPGMVVQYNQARQNGASGFELNNLGADSGTLLLGNESTGNAGDGFVVGAGVTGTKVRQNSAISNGHLDFNDLGTGTILGTGDNQNFFGTVGP